MTKVFGSFGQIWRLAAPYFRSQEKWPAIGLLLVMVAVELGQTFNTVQLSTWTRRFNNALAMRDVTAWTHELMVWAVIGVAAVILLVLQLYMNQWLQIRWRRWMTARYLREWLQGGNHYRIQLRGGTDNPDQRISDDIQLFISTGLTLAVGLLGAITSLISFLFILWGLSARTPLPVMGHDYSFPGYLVVAALTVAGVGTIVTHVFGRQLIPLNFDQQRYEADFRFALVRVRENSEQIALLRGETTEQRALMDKFAFVASNWRMIMGRSMQLTFANGAVGQFMFLIPFLLIGPAILAGKSQFGDYFQTTLAFGTVQGSFAFFILQYRVLAGWKAVIDRLDGFETATAAAEQQANSAKRINIAASETGKHVEINQLDLRLPDGTPLIGTGNLAFAPGERILISGPSGAGKSTMFRAIGGIWPYGSGQVQIPANAKVMIVPQKPYLPIGSLADAVAFPAAAADFERDDVEQSLKMSGLAGFVARLDEHGHWSQTLSLGEQQRVAIARALLHKPDVLMLDEATASLDEPSEARLYNLMRSALTDTTIISIAHRSALKALHERRVLFVKEGEFSRVVEDRSSGRSESGGPVLGVVDEP